MQTIRCIKWLMGAAFLLGAMAAHAEGGCPAGQLPSQGTDVQSCTPIPGYNSQSQDQTQPPVEGPAVRWADKWGAIATHGPSGSLGGADDMPTQSAAEQAALAKCHAQHGSTCEVLSYYRNSCGVMVIDGTGNYYNTSTATDLNEAAQKAVKPCSSNGHQNCHVYYSGCSFPVRTQ